MTIEEELELALRAEAARVDPPVADLVSGGMARGREQRRLRRTRLAVGASAMVVAGAVAAVVAAPFVGDDGPVATGGSAADAVRGAVAPPAGELDPQTVLDTAVALLPAGDVTESSSGSYEPGSAWYQFRYDDGDGASWIMGSAGVAAPGWETPTCPVIVNGGSCEVTTLDDGTVLMLTAGPYYPQPDREPERLLWGALAVAPSGLRVTLGEMNTPTEKDSEPTRDAPPLSLDQLTAVVTDDVWAELTAGFEPPAPPEEEEPPQPEIPDETRAFAATLGPGWTPVDVGVAEPDPSLGAGLPDGYTLGFALLDHLGPDLTLEQHCAPGEEKGAFTEACVTGTAPDGQPVHLQWGGTVSEGPYAQSSIENRVSVLVTADTGRLVRASLWVADDAATSTPERRETARAWLGEQVDDLARAVTAAAADQPS